MTWDPAQYLKFADHRLRPAIDLLNRIDLDSPQVVYDLGAGTGSITEMLADRWPRARVVGVDNSPEMLERAERIDNMEWEEGDIGTWRPDEPCDLIFSNAALHWVDGHVELFQGLMASVSAGGLLAVQMPRNFGALSHTSISKAALDGPWRSVLEPLLRPAPVELPQYYARILSPLASSLDIWETDYIQVLRGDNPVKEWTKGTWLMPLLSALEEPERSEFETAYGELILDSYPKERDGTTLFPFRRMFIVAGK